MSKLIKIQKYFIDFGVLKLKGITNFFNLINIFIKTTKINYFSNDDLNKKRKKAVQDQE